MPRNWENAAGIVWPILIQSASSRTTITYGDIAPVINTNPLSVGRALGPIQNYCIDNKLPPLTSIVVSVTNGIPGDGFVAWDVDDISEGHKLVFDFNWSLILNPYGGFDTNDTVESFANMLLENPKNSEDVYARVKVRGIAQKIFRLALMEVYDYKCAFCGLTFTEALHGAHILPWSLSTKSERLDPRNGILLCSVHHSLFDAGLITISESFKIAYYDAEQDNETYSKIDKSMTTELHGNKIHIPEPRYSPKTEYIQKRNEIDKWGRLL